MRTPASESRFLSMVDRPQLNIVHLTPGAGGMYCGGCFRDNAMVGSLRQQGHDVLMVPLYLPLNLDEPDQSAGTPVFFSGISVYIQQKIPWLRRMPRWFSRLMANRILLKLAGKAAAKTRPSEVGELTISMLQGENGNQAREVELLCDWLKQQNRVDIVCLSNSLLIGVAKTLKQALKKPIVCTFQGEEGFIEELGNPYRGQTWSLLKERSREIDLFIAPSQYSAEYMTKRLDLRPQQIKTIYNGINLEGFAPSDTPPKPPTLGFFARLCREKGLEILAEAYLTLKKRQRIPGLKLRLGGSMGPSDQPLVDQIMQRFQEKGVAGDVELHPNLSREAKLAFYRSLSVLTAPTLIGEAFGLYVIEALASGVPVVLPSHGAFPELISETQAGLLFEPHNSSALADAVENILCQQGLHETLRQSGLRNATSKFSISRMTNELANEYFRLIHS